MAQYTPRTIDQIYQSILAEKQNFTSLSGLSNEISSEQELLTALTSNSKVSIYLMWIYLTAVCTWSMEKIMESFVKEVETIKDSAIIGNEKWLIAKTKEFQYGDTLEINPTTYAVNYAVEDPTKQIIESAAIEQSGLKTLLKIRRKDTDLLSTDELNAFKSYINKIKFAGQRIVPFNYLPDLIKLYINIVYDPLYPLATLQTNVENTINLYIENIEFDSYFNVNKLIDNLQLVDGVVDVEFNNAYGKFDIGSYVAFTHKYKSVAGYCSIDPTFPLSSTLTYEIKY